MNDDRYIFSRPVVVTEDRIKTALEKQAKQKALKAALDRQVREAERLKAEAHRTKGKRPSDPKVNGPPVSSSAYVGSKVPTASPAATNSVAGPSPTVGATVAPDVVDSTRYSFSFRKGQGTFEMESSSVLLLQATLPPFAEGRERGGGGAVPPVTAGDAGKASARERRQAASREAASGTGRRSSRGGRPTPASNGGEYQTNSLPLYLSAAKEAAGRKLPSPERGVGDSDAIGQSKRKGSDGYDTQSLPVERIYKLGQATSNAAVKPLLRGITTPLRPPSSGRASEPRGLQSPLGSLAGAVSGSPMAAARDNFTSPPTGSTRSPDWIGVGGGRPLLSPQGFGKGVPCVLGNGGGTPKEKALGLRYASPRPSARLAGGILPPLNARNDSDVIEMSAVFDAAPPPRECRVAGALSGAPSGRTLGSTAQPLSRRQASNTPAERPTRPSPPQSPLDAAAAEQARKQAERERAWAQQVKQIKAELRKTRTKGSGKGGLKSGGRGAMGDAPRRAETAPDPLPHPHLWGGLGVGGGGASGAGAAHGRYGGGGAKGNAGGSRPPPVGRMDFAKAHIFTRENFRPITAPEDATSYFGMLSPPPSLPPLVKVSKTKPREQVEGSSEFVAALKGDEAAGTEASSSPNLNAIITFVSTGTSGEESLKLASLTTRQVTLGLPDYGNSDPVPIQFNHLLQFVEAQMITASQAESLWDFFAVLPEAVRGGGCDSDAGGAGSSLLITSTREVWGRAARGDANGAADERESSALEAVEERPAMNGAAPGGVDAVESKTDDGRAFYVPRSPSQLPTSAVLAPALRRKISQQHSGHDAAVVHQPHKPQHNGHHWLGSSGTSGGGGEGIDGGAGGVGSGHRASPPKMRGLQKQLSITAEHGGEGGDEDEGAGTFDTFSELVLPACLKDDEDD
ncbi:hypothetical protein CUR178_03178 [Leishmania enriettii]|uniref:Uncharacterized protein n=1 Tax=Leishmania enriettii TaxID=5663 RepID=A0A836KPD8_LEIEN|nr:hypothetical protein CUR178_03178 [Leishmania enriettii]